MITDEIIRGLKLHIESAGAPLSTATVFERDTSDDLTYPAILITEDGDPEEHEIRRGHWTVGISVQLKTIPEKTTLTAHEAMNEQLWGMLADSPGMIAALDATVDCNDSWGGEGVTSQEDGYRVTSFALEIKAARLS